MSEYCHSRGRPLRLHRSGVVAHGSRLLPRGISGGRSGHGAVFVVVGQSTRRWSTCPRSDGWRSVRLQEMLLLGSESPYAFSISGHGCPLLSIGN